MNTDRNKAKFDVPDFWGHPDTNISIQPFGDNDNKIYVWDSAYGSYPEIETVEQGEQVIKNKLQRDTEENIKWHQDMLEQLKKRLDLIKTQGLEPFRRK